MDNIPDYIYFKNKDSRFIRNNKAHLKLFGLLKQEDTLGKSNHDFYPSDFADQTLRDEKKIFKTGKSLINKIENISAIRDQRTWISTTKVPIKDETGHITGIVGISRDITERMIAEEKIQTSLQEKEVLLKEIHHRVKNNLQVISSLLNLQSSYIKDPEVLSIFRESQNRIRSMSLIHENLYKVPDIIHLDLPDYIDTLIKGIKESYQKYLHKVQFDLHIEDIPLSIDQAVPCGLIITELVSNALKHAFVHQKNNDKVYVHFTMPESNCASLLIKDNGQGIPERFDWKNVKSLGLKLVRLLVEGQLEGTIHITRDYGTNVHINFPLNKTTK